LKSFNFTSFINVPTRISDLTRTCLDHIFVNDPDSVREANVFQTHISDHFPVYLVCNYAKPNVSDRIISKTDWCAVKTDIRNISWDDTELYTETNVSKISSCFINQLTNCVSKNTNTYIDRGRKDYRRNPIKPWISNTLLKCIKKRDR